MLSKLIATNIIWFLVLSVSGCQDGRNSIPEGKIAFVSTRDNDNSDIFVINTKGKDLVNLTGHPAEDANPSWSPDGSRIVFTSDRDGHRQLYVMQADGSNVKRLTHSNSVDDLPVWSPNGETIAYVSDGEIWSVELSNLLTKQLTGYEGHDATSPTWSPNGEQIAYADYTYNEFRIAVMDADGRNRVLLPINLNTEPDFSIWGISWTSDVSLIAYSSPNTEPVQMYGIKTNGSTTNLLLKTEKNVVNFSWSPDGNYVVFQSDGNGNTPDLWIASLDGTIQFQLTNSVSFDGQPSWMP